jgi:hypothetical protein
MVSDLAGGALFCWLLKADVVASISMLTVNLSPARMLAIRNMVQFWIGQSFPIAVIISLIVVVIDGFRIVRISRGGGVDLGNGNAVSAR